MALMFWKLSSDIKPLTQKMGKFENFVVSFGTAQQGNSAGAVPTTTGATSSTPAQVQGRDPFDAGLDAIAELLHRQNENCPSTVREPDAPVSGSTPVRSTNTGRPNLNRAVNLQGAVENYEAVQEAARKMKLDCERYIKPEADALLIPTASSP